MRLPVKEFMDMDAEQLPDGRVRFLVSEHGFLFLHSWLGEAKGELWNKKEEFPKRVGTTFEEAESLGDEFFLIRFGPLGYPRRDPHTKRLRGPDGVRRTGTAWDELPKMEAQVLPDGRLELKLARAE